MRCLASPLDRQRVDYWHLRVRTHIQSNDDSDAFPRPCAYFHETQLRSDFCELGISRGINIVNAWLSFRYLRAHLKCNAALPFSRTATVANCLNQKSVFYGFTNTFSCMPDKDETEDSLATDTFVAHQEVATSLCKAAGLKVPELSLASGLSADNTQAIAQLPASIVHLDNGLYVSTRFALSLIQPCLVQGTVLLFDDYELLRAGTKWGQRQALLEFNKNYGIVLKQWFADGAASRAFLCRFPESELLRQR